MSILKSALILLSLIFPKNLSGSCWEDYPWGKSELTTVQRDWIKTIVMSGLTSYVEIQNIDGGQDIWLIKADSEGNEEWSKTYGGKDLDQGSYITETSYGNYIITGNFSPGNSTSTVGSDIIVMMVNRTGELIWSETYGGDHDLSDDYGIIVKMLSDDDMIVVGVIYDFLSHKTKELIVRLNKDGNTIWEKKIDNIWPEDIFIESDSRFLISGKINDDFFILELDDKGETQNLNVF